MGGATTCLEIEGGDESFLLCDMGSGLREFGIDAFRRIAGGRKPIYNFLHGAPALGPYHGLPLLRAGLPIPMR